MHILLITNLQWNSSHFRKLTFFGLVKTGFGQAKKKCVDPWPRKDRRHNSRRPVFTPKKSQSRSFLLSYRWLPLFHPPVFVCGDARPLHHALGVQWPSGRPPNADSDVTRCERDESGGSGCDPWIALSPACLSNVAAVTQWR